MGMTFGGRALTVGLILATVLMGAFGQVLLKLGVTTVRDRFAGDLGGITRFLIGALTTPAVLGGFLLYGAASLLWLVIIARTPLSLAYPMLALGYVIVIASSAWLFGEALPMIRILGIGAILIGIFLISRTA
ncbi:MAG: multidrug resistance protein [Armatimonadetes bacterium]|nr:multidrug resistance protein [Armatimonadota bacterium]